MEQVPLLGGARRLATSSTALLGILAIAAAITMSIYGRIEGQSALDFVKWVVIAYFTKVAVEDGAEKFGTAGKTDAVSPAEAPTQPEEKKEEEKE